MEGRHINGALVFFLSKLSNVRVLLRVLTKNEAFSYPFKIDSFVANNTENSFHFLYLIIFEVF